MFPLRFSPLGLIFVVMGDGWWLLMGLKGSLKPFVQVLLLFGGCDFAGLPVGHRPVVVDILVVGVSINKVLIVSPVEGCQGSSSIVAILFLVLG